ncbi:MAG: transposase [Phycisphaeraceae bacterium]|nr:transposase [Phycisphaeraceae bacterium]MCW5755474.1 transposase [Phycisphaeraceae bacterium]
MDQPAPTQSFETRVPTNHPFRAVLGAIDFSPARDMALPPNCTLDPVVAFKLYYLGFLEHVTSDAELLSKAAYRLDWMWFCGMGEGDRLPDLGHLLALRQTWGRDHFEELLGTALRRSAKLKLLGKDAAKVDRRGRCVAEYWDRLENSAPRMIASEQAPESASGKDAVSHQLHWPETSPREQQAQPSGEKPSPRRHGRMVCELLRSNLGEVIDLSAGGMKVMFKGRHPPKLDKCRKLKLRCVDGVLRLQGVIVWARTQDSRHQVLGVRFTDLTPLQTERLKALAKIAGVRRALRPLSPSNAA